MSSNLKPLPKFKSEQDEQKFWATHDSTDYVDWDNAYVNPALPNLKPSKKVVSLRLPEALINEVKRQANELDMPYQTLMKQKLFEVFKIV